jgi:hypothetical protein
MADKKPAYEVIIGLLKGRKKYFFDRGDQIVKNFKQQTIGYVLSLVEALLETEIPPDAIEGVIASLKELDPLFNFTMVRSPVNELMCNR